MDSCDLPPQKIQNNNFLYIKDIDYSRFYIFHTTDDDCYLKNNSIIMFLENYNKDSKRVWFYNLIENNHDWFFHGDPDTLNFYESKLEML